MVKLGGFGEDSFCLDFGCKSLWEYWAGKAVFFGFLVEEKIPCCFIM